MSRINAQLTTAEERKTREWADRQRIDMPKQPPVSLLETKETLRLLFPPKKKTVLRPDTSKNHVVAGRKRRAVPSPFPRSIRRSKWRYRWMTLMPQQDWRPQDSIVRWTVKFENLYLQPPTHSGLINLERSMDRQTHTDSERKMNRQTGKTNRGACRTLPWLKKKKSETRL